MSKFVPKTIHINQNAIDQALSSLSEFCNCLNELSGEFKAVIGYTPDLETVRGLLKRENREIYRFLRSYPVREFNLDLSLDRYKTPEELLVYFKEEYLKQHTDAKGIEVAGVKINFQKMIGLVDFPSFDGLIAKIRKAIKISHVVFGNDLNRGVLCNMVNEDLANIYDNGAFCSDLIKSEIIEHFTTKTQTEEENQMVDLLSDVCEKLNVLKSKAQILYASRSERSGIFEGIDYFVDLEDGKFVVSRNLLTRRN